MRGLRRGGHGGVLRMEGRPINPSMIDARILQRHFRQALANNCFPAEIIIFYCVALDLNRFAPVKHSPGTQPSS